MSYSPEHADWLKKATDIQPRSQAFINGRYVDAQSNETFENINPATGKIINQVASCDKNDVELAVKAARISFEKGHWRSMAPSARKKILQKFAQLINANREHLALLETLDMGKPISDSFSDDIPGSANTIAWYGEAIDKLYDEVAPTDKSIFAMITREPVGVVAAIVPWNYPLLMACWKIGPALASGNSLILKPSEKSPLTAIAIAELASEAGIPDGVFNVLPGFGEKTGEPLALHPDVDCIAFTGSGAVGKKLLIYSGQSNMKRVWLECGGKTPHIILNDVDDIDMAAKAAAMGIFVNQGEVCNAGSRLLIDENAKDMFIEKVVEISKTMYPADPLDPQTKMGAIVDDIQLKRVLGYIDNGLSEGATLVSGGKQVHQQTGGFFIEPTVFDHVKNDMKIAQEEIFGPVLSTITFKDEQQAIEIANDSVYGLAAAVWTSNVKKAHRIASQLRAGSVWVNCFDGGDITTPFGGFKQSGNGRDKSLHAIDKYTELKTTWMDIG